MSFRKLLVDVFSWVSLSFLNEFSFSLSHDENRAWRRPSNAICRAAQPKMFPAPDTVSCHNDQIDIEFFGRLDDLMRCNSSANA
jgi:hypothetical protein